MRKRICSALGTFVAAMMIVAGAQAQIAAPQAEFDQYPSFIQMTSATPDGGQSVLRCGYAVAANGVIPDAAFLEMSALNEQTGAYFRTQRIDHTVMATTIAPGIPGHFLLEVTEPNGAVATKNCISNPTTDTIQNCVPAQPFIPATQLIQQDINLTNQCSAFFNGALPKIDPTVFNAQKTDVFKLGLRQKAALLQGP